jgi:glycosyltransferase involved in cell wall biosynthesis
LKVLHVEAGRHLYGGARQVIYLVEGLLEHGVDSVLACPEGSALAGRPWPGGVRLAPLPMGGDLDPGLAGRLGRLITETRPDLVHLHSRRGADWAGALAGRRARLPVVLTRRVDNPEPRWVVPLKYRLYDRVIAISEAIARVLADAGVPREKIVTVPSAVAAPAGAYARAEARRHLAVPESAFVAGMAAQFIGRKGHRILLDALPEITGDIPNLRVILFGRGPMEESLRAEVSRRGLDAVVRFAGFRDDFEALLPGLDLLVHPAMAEGLGVAVLQAARAGIPVVAAAAGGLPEIVVDGQTGWLVTPGDAVGLARAMREVAADPAGARGRAQRGQARVRERFSVQAMVAGNLAVYRRLVPGPGT